MRKDLNYLPCLLSFAARTRFEALFHYGCLVAVSFEDWESDVAHRSDPRNPQTIEIPIKPSPRGGSGTFLAADGDGNQW